MDLNKSLLGTTEYLLVNLYNLNGNSYLYLKEFFTVKKSRVVKSGITCGYHVQSITHCVPVATMATPAHCGCGSCAGSQWLTPRRNPSYVDSDVILIQLARSFFLVINTFQRYHKVIIYNVLLHRIGIYCNDIGTCTELYHWSIIVGRYIYNWVIRKWFTDSLFQRRT